MRVFMAAKQEDQGVNIVLPKNEKNWKQYFFMFLIGWR